MDSESEPSGAGTSPPSDAASSDAASSDAALDQSTRSEPGRSDAEAVERADAAEAHLADALERVAHGATVSVPSILVARGLTVAFTAVLTNGFAAGAYGVFAVARRLQQFLLYLSLGFGGGLSRFLPTAESDAERDALVTVASVLLLGVASVFGAALYLGAPLVTRVASQGPQFQTLLRVFALGLPATVWLFATTEVLRGLEAVGPLNLAFRVGFPAAQLGVAVVGTVVFGDLVVVAAGVVAVMGLVGVAVGAWLARDRGVRPRLRHGGGSDAVWRRYLRYTFPLFLSAFATTAQRLGFYPLIALYLTDVAGGVFAVGMVVGSLVRLPLMGINQFISPVAAALHEADHREALARLYHVTSRLVLVGVTGLSVPVIVYRETVMSLFGPTFVAYAPLLVGFVLAQYGACTAGSVGILLRMTDNQRALLLVNTVVTLALLVTAVPLTRQYGLPGLVASFVLMLVLNNGLEVAVLYHLERLQPFTRLHLKPLAAAIPMAGVGLAAKAFLVGPVGPAVGVGVGLAVYGVALRALGFTAVERRLGGTLAARYWTVLSRE